ncbi:FUSC family protein [Paraburkholderia sp. BL25I1N1]|uniref:FUSC family protein n=1 Tax=Paraburkholderia sp. BL25I1N1 TaxID=1938804 RepID=UPI000D49F24A|nr:FUSC family protein [Paraburkholderia sp. BL25I1N1]PRY07980.1 fusaric acid resistance family protein [Paraburkholderia sp. BL25I1N1]
MNETIGLKESAWAITASTYVVAGSASGTAQRVRRRIIGTLVGVPLGLACLPLVEHVPLLAWAAVAAAMIVYAMALPERYDVACGAFAFTLIVTLAIGGVHSISFLGARAWETLLGGAVGLLAAKFIFPLRV